MAKTQTKGSEMAEQLTNFINSATTKDKRDFVNAMMTEHRTLQEDTFKLFLDTCEQWAEMGELDRYDARNEFTVNFSQKIMDLLNQ